MVGPASLIGHPARLQRGGQADAAPRRWQTFADAIALALGINLWVSLVLLPWWFGDPLPGRAGLAAAFGPLLVLGLGVLRRSDAMLLFGFPAALLVPITLAPGIVQVHVYSPWRLALVAAGLIAYLFGASVFTSFRLAPPPAAIRPLASAGRPTPARWRRRFRVYRGLVALALVFPAVLLHAVHFDDATQVFLREKYAGRVAEVTTFLDLLVVGFWVLIYATTFHGLLAGHRTGDRPLEAALARLAAGARRPRPGAIFYLGVAVAIGLMFLLVTLRS